KNASEKSENPASFASLEKMGPQMWPSGNRRPGVALPARVRETRGEDMINRIRMAGLLVSTALASAGVAATAHAQAAAAPGQASGVDVLSDIVVTATRQADTVNRVLLSISAVTQKSLD